MGRFNRRRRMLWMALFAALLLLAILIAGSVLDSARFAANFAEKRQPPSIAHPFGTDTIGRDVFFRSLKGLATSIQIGLAAAALSAFLALLLGLAAALFGRRCDRVVTWLVDLCMSVPHLVLILMISFMLGRGARGVALGVALTHWPGITRIVRAEVMQLRSAPFVLAAQKLGRTRWQIAFQHLVPLVLPQFLVALLLMFPHAIMHEASVTFLGFGLSMDTPAIGVILSESMKNLPLGLWWTAAFPGAMLVLIVALFHILGKNLQQLLDPYTGNE